MSSPVNVRLALFGLTLIILLPACGSQSNQPNADTPAASSSADYLSACQGEMNTIAGGTAELRESVENLRTTRGPFGHLPAETIRQVVRSNFDTFVQCYQDGLSRSPQLDGEIGVSFVIERDGSVTSTAAVTYTLPDCAVGQCVLKQFEKLAFPSPEAGIVTVVYPIRFSPG